MIVLAIDPGVDGAFVFWDGRRMHFELMPLKEADEKEIDFSHVKRILALGVPGGGPCQPQHVFLERAMSFGMAARFAFNYGRGFAAIEIAIAQSCLPVTYVEPGKWSKVIHQGISNDLKPKAKSLIALERLIPGPVRQMIPRTPKSQKMHEGVVDALLIAEYGLRTLAGGRA